MLNSFCHQWSNWTSCCLQHAGWSVTWSTSFGTIKWTQKLHNFVHITWKVNKALIRVRREFVKVQFA